MNRYKNGHNIFVILSLIIGFFVCTSANAWYRGGGGYHYGGYNGYHYGGYHYGDAANHYDNTHTGNTYYSGTYYGGYNSGTSIVVNTAPACSIMNVCDPNALNCQLEQVCN